MKLSLLFLVLLTASASAEAPRPSSAQEEPFCGTHGVLEAVCTRCNPRLIPIFKAKKDWCEEHRFPGSFCPQCHPERKGRPAVDLRNEKAPADGLRVKLRSPETATLAGIEVAKVAEEPDRPAVHAWVQLVRDPSRAARINPRAAGVTRSLDAQVGDRVEPGHLLASIESALVGLDRSKLESARTRVRVATSNIEREKNLFELGLSAQRSILVAEQELATARADMEAAEAALSVAGKSSSAVGPSRLESPVGGVVTQRHTTLGEFVDTDDILFEVVDFSVLWAKLQVLETEVTSIAIGQNVDLTFPSLPGRTFSGKLTFLSPIIDPKSRTVEARVILPNAGGLLRENLYGEARIHVGPPRSSFVLPRTAVQRVEDVWLAFVRIAPDEFETRRLQVGDFDHERIHVVKGLKAGEEVATTGSFLLKTETLKGSIGAGCCEAPEKK